MPANNVRSWPLSSGIASIVFGLVGLVFFWWFPFGAVLSLAGLVIGLFGWFTVSGRASPVGLMIAGTVISAAALALELWIYFQGWEAIKFTGLQ